MYHKAMYYLFRWLCKVMYHRVYVPCGQPAPVKAVITRAIRVRGQYRDKGWG